MHFLWHQTLCANLKEESDRHQRCSERRNLKLAREFEASSLEAETLETNIQVLSRMTIMIPKLHQFLFLFLSKQFVTNCCFGQKIKQLIEDIKKIEQDHQRASVHLEKEKKLRCERLKAAQVKKRKKTVSSSGVKEQL